MSSEIVNNGDGTVSVVIEVDTTKLDDSLDRITAAAWGLERSRSLRILATALPKVDRPPELGCYDLLVVTAGHFVWGSAVGNA